MKVYVIEKGEYSDRRIIGVTLTEEEANEIKDTIESYDDTTVTEYDTDQFKTSLFRFEVCLPRGDVEFRFLYENEGKKSHLDYVCGRSAYYIVYAKTREHALKIASDMEARRMAEESGII